ncbi:MAG TPA: hypothetical protein VML50_17065 [Anaeromyxobacter sp.]|nr:hypothetical protein [Anaeromyxobacter sp.]
MAALLALLLALPTADAAVAAALARPGARAEVEEVRRSAGRGCQAERFEALRPVEASGQVPLRVEGRDAAGAPCQAWVYARVRVLAPALLLDRPLEAGEPLEGAVRLAEVEIRAGRAPLAALPPEACAARPLRAGHPLEPSDVREGPAPGAPVAVVVRAGEVELTAEGVVAPCERGRACAVLPSGRRVQGRYAAGRILVEAP